YNLPTANEIAVIIPGDETQPVAAHDIILRRHTGGLDSIGDGHAAYTCLHYVLLFPWGTPGWSYNLMLLPRPGVRQGGNAGTTTWMCMTQVQSYSYQLHPCNSEFSLLHHGGSTLHA
ncbi:hypothetical protein OF83DRAFT_1073238, partial [Amylostereum chailletii]